MKLKDKIKHIYKNNLKFNVFLYILLLTIAIAFIIVSPTIKIDERLKIFIGMVIVILWCYQDDKLATLYKDKLSKNKHVLQQVNQKYYNKGGKRK